MLPDVDSDDWDEGKKGVLVGGGGDLEALRGSVETKPAPSTALDSKGRGVKLLLHVLEAPEIGYDGLLERARLESAAGAFALGRGGREVFPEEGVVDVAASVELESGLQGDALLGGGRLGVRGLGGVEGVDVSLVVLLVVKLHDLAGDVRLERVVGVREVGERAFYLQYLNVKVDYMNAIWHVINWEEAEKRFLEGSASSKL